ARSLGVGARPTQGPPEPAGARQLAGDHLHLLAKACHTADVAELLGLLELVAELAEPGLVGTAGRRGERPATATRSPVAGAAEIERMELVAGMPEQLDEVGEALHVLEPRELALAGDGPDAALLPEAGGAACGPPRRRRWSRHRGPLCPGVCRKPLPQRDEAEPRRRRGGRRV